MNGAEDVGERLQAAVAQAKSTRSKLDKTIVRVVKDARADAPLIELRKALDRMEEIAAELP